MGCNQYKQYLSSEVTDGQVVTPSREYLLGEAVIQALGYYIFIDFLVGTNIIERQEGYLSAVGVDYIILYNPTKQVYVYGSLYSIKFIYYTDVSDFSVVLDWDRMANI